MLKDCNPNIVHLLDEEPQRLQLAYKYAFSWGIIESSISRDPSTEEMVATMKQVPLINSDLFKADKTASDVKLFIEL